MRFLQHPDLFLTAGQEELKPGVKNFIQEFSSEKELQKLKKQITGYDAQEKGDRSIKHSLGYFYWRLLW